MRRILLALAALALLAPAARAADCTAATSGTWTALGAGDATWSGAGCTGSPAYPSATANAVIPATIAVTIPDGSVITQTTTGGITVGGSLVGALDATPTTAGITLGSAGITCQAGSTCSFTGRYLTPGTSPTWDTSPSTTSYLQVGDAVPCPGGDCTLMRFSYPAATYDAATGTALDRGINESILALLPGDILCLWNPSGIDTAATPDVNACYPIAAVNGSSSPYTIDFTVRVAPNLPVPAKQQDLLTGTLQAAASKGTRTLSVPSTVIDDSAENTTTGTGKESSYFVGRWIRLEQASGGTYEPFAYRVLKAVDGTGANPDTLTIASLKGLGRDYASGDDFALDYGWRRGDPLLIYRPFHIGSATAAYNDSEPIFYGTVTLKAVHLEKVQDIEFYGASVVDAGLQDIFLQESDNGTSAGGLIAVTAVTNPITFTRLVGIGGDAAGSATNQTQHGMKLQAVHPTNGPAVDLSVTVADSLFRYMGDDCFVPNAPVGGTITVNRFRCQWGADGGASESFWDDTASRMSMIDRQIECLDCTNHDSDTGPDLFSHRGSGTLSADGVLAYGLRNAVHKEDWTDGAVSIANLAIVGGGSSNINNSNWLTPVADKFVVREVSVGKTGAYLQNQGIATTQLRLTNGLVVDFAQTSTQVSAIATSSTAAVRDVIRNVAFVDLVNSNANSAVIVGSSAEPDGSELTGITIAYRPGFTAANMVQRGISVQDTTPVYTLNRSLFYGLLRTSAVGIYASGASAYGGTLVRDRNCFFANTSDISAAVVANLSADSVRDVPPQFASIAGEQFTGRLGSWNRTLGCGATPSAGITRYQWIHAISDLEPESLGSVTSGGASGWLPRAF